MKQLQKNLSLAIGMALLFFTPQAFANSNANANNKITICTDTNFWYPFTYIKNQDAAGLHIDIVSAALRRLGYEPNFKPAAWNECLNYSKDGIVDAVATASYRDDRAVYLNYPHGAAVDMKSPWRVSQVSYVLVTPAVNKEGQKSNYLFKGIFKSIPDPVRVPQHYSVARDLEKEGVQVKEGKNSQAIFKDLVKTHTGSVVDVQEVADFFATQPQFADKVIIHDKHLNNKSYYLAFSKKSKLTKLQTEAIWKEIAKIREDKKLMAEFLTKY